MESTRLLMLKQCSDKHISMLMQRDLQYGVAVWEQSLLSTSQSETLKQSANLYQIVPSNIYNHLSKESYNKKHIYLKYSPIYSLTSFARKLKKNLLFPSSKKTICNYSQRYPKICQFFLYAAKMIQQSLRQKSKSSIELSKATKKFWKSAKATKKIVDLRFIARW